MKDLDKLIFDSSVDDVPWQGESLKANLKNSENFQLQSKAFLNGADFGRQWTLQKDPMLQSFLHRISGICINGEGDLGELELLVEDFLEYTKEPIS